MTPQNEAARLTQELDLEFFEDHPGRLFRLRLPTPHETEKANVPFMGILVFYIRSNSPNYGKRRFFRFGVDLTPVITHRAEVAQLNTEENCKQLFFRVIVGNPELTSSFGLLPKQLRREHKRLQEELAA